MAGRPPATPRFGSDFSLLIHGCQVVNHRGFDISDASRAVPPGFGPDKEGGADRLNLPRR